MERIQVLIAKLKEQADPHADAEQMLATLQLLQNELSDKELPVAPPERSNQPGQYTRYIESSCNDAGFYENGAPV